MNDCFKKYQNHVDELIDIQNLLSDICENNLETTIEFIKSSKLYQDKEKIKILLKIIGIFIRIRRNRIHCYFQLIDSILPKILEKFTKEEIMYFFRRKEIHCKLHKDKIISSEDIAIYYGTENPKLSFFYPEMAALFSKYPSIEKSIKNSTQYDSVYKIFTQDEGIDLNSLNIENDPRLQIGNVDQLSVSIRSDDIDSFQSIISKTNIKIRSHKIQLSHFELNKCISSRSIYLIEYAAFHGSLKIFKFLLMNDAPFSKELFKCAVCGGNHEIVHLTEKIVQQTLKDEDMKEISNLAIIFHRYELFEYLIETYNIKIQYNDFLMSIFHNNYSFFTTHIIEYEEEYERLLSIKETSYISEQENLKLNEMKEKTNDFLIISSENVDLFFLETLSSFKDINFNQGFEPKSNNESLTNPLAVAIQSKSNENAKFILSFDSTEVDVKLTNRMTPFMWACYAGNLEMVKYLIDNFSDSINILNVIQQSGENALHLAVRQSNFDVVKYLISLRMFDLSMKSSQGETILQTAARLGYKDIFDFLKTIYIKEGIKVEDDLIVNDERFFPQKHIKPIGMAFALFNNLKEPIPLCLLI